MNKKEWFDEWFDTKYYHILYQHRDYTEAENFISNLIKVLKLQTSDKILDLACGKGRHSIFLNTQGFNVTGVDLSSQSIKSAKEFEKEGLKFEVHDMRETYREEGFSHIFNLFTSFGYFAQEAENLKTIMAISAGLKAQGTLVLDFLNPYVIINNLVKEEEKELNGITFKIHREVEDGWIVKNIRFTDENKDFHFQERVKAITEQEFQQYFLKAGLIIENTFGNYNLDSYIASESERLIFVAKKK